MERLATTGAIGQSLLRFWRRLTEPDRELNDPEQRYHARLLASLLLTLAPLGLIVSVVTALALRPRLSLTDSNVPVAVVGISLGLLAYRFSRTRHFEHVSRFLVIGFSVAIFVALLRAENASGQIALGYLVMPVLLSSVLLSLRSTAAVAVLQMLAFWLVGTIEPALLPHNLVIRTEGFLALSSLLIFLIIYYRNQLEQERQATLAIREERYRQAVYNSPNPIFSIDNAGNIVTWNEACSTTFQYDDAIIGQSYEQLLRDPEAQERVAGFFRRVVLNNETFSNIKLILHAKDGTRCEMASRLYPILNTAGQVRECVFANTDMTARRQADEALRQSETRLAQAQQIAKMGNWWRNLVTGETYWSDELYRLYEIDPAEMPPTLETFFNIVHPGDRVAVQQGVEAAINDRKPFNIDYRVLLPSGELRFVHAQAEVHYDNQGAPLRMVGVAQDITERKRAEDALRQSEERFRWVFEQGPLGMVISDSTTRMLQVNNKFAELLGYPLAEVSDLSWADVTHPDDIVSNTALSKRLFDNEIDTYQLEKRYLKKNGDTVWGQVVVAAIRDENGAILHNLAMVEDITERKQTEEQLRKLSRVVEQSPSAILITDTTGTIEYANARFEQLTGYSVDELIGLTPAKPQSGRMPLATYRQLWRTIQSGGQWRGELQNKRKDGTLYWAFETISPIKNASGHITHYVATLEDISQRKQAEEALRQSQETYKTLVGSIDGIVWEANADDFALTFMSEQAQRILGYPTESWLSKSAFQHDRIHPEDRTWVVAYLREAVEDGESFELEHRMIAADGRVLWLHDFITIDKADGRPTKLRGVTVNVTERREQEDALRRYAERLKLLHEIDRAISAAQSLAAIADAALSHIRPLVPYVRGSITVFDLEQDEAEVIAVYTTAESKLLRGTRVSASATFGDIEQLKRGLISEIPDYAEIEEFSPTAGRAHREGVRSSFFTPLIAQGELVGTLNLGAETAHAFGDEHKQVAQEVAGSLAIAIQQARLYEQLELHADELQNKTESLSAINAVADTVYHSFEFDTVVDRALDSIVAYLDGEDAMVTLFGFDESTSMLRLLAFRGYGESDLPAPELIPIQGSIAERVLARRAVVVSEDLATDEELDAEIREQFLQRGLVSGLATPLLFQEQVLGTVNLGFRHERIFTAQEIDTLSSIGKSIGLAMANARHVAQIEAEIAERKRAEAAEREQRLLSEALHEIADVLNSTLDLNEVLDRILDQAALVIPHNEADIMMIEDGVATPVRFRLYIQAPDYDILKVRFSLATTGTLRKVVEAKSPIFIPDTREDKQWVTVPGAEWIRSYLGAPIIIDDTVHGFINLNNAAPNAFSAIHMKILQTFANDAAIAIRNARLYEKIHGYALEQERRVAERTRELEVERKQLQVILDATGEGILYTEHLEIQYLNQALTHIMGYAQNELIGQPLTAFADNLIGEETREKINALQQIIETGEVWRDEIKLRHKSGHDFDAGITVSRVGNDEPIRTVTVLRDISQEKQLEAQKSRFISNASHELRTPIANMKTRLYLARKQPQRLESHLQVMENVADRMRNLVENLLDISRFERGVISLKREVTTLQSLLAEVYEVQLPEAERKSIELVMDVPAEPLAVFIDEQRIVQVVTNLVTNAINYTSDGGRIDLSATLEHDRFVALAVRDNGVGIPEDYLTQIFQPFFRVSDEGEGTGLGLSISKEIVELHDAEISVESTLGEGSCFMVKFPLVS